MSHVDVLYILGLFEDEGNSLFNAVQKDMAGLGVNCEAVALYAGRPFGSYSLCDEIERIARVAEEVKPKLIVAHSLGAYMVLQRPVGCPAILLDPSLSINEIILPNTKAEKGSFIYDDGANKISLESEFVESVRRAKSIEEIAASGSVKDVTIFGTGKGGHKAAEQYHKYMPRSQYIFLQEADHNFSSQTFQTIVFDTIQRRLGR